MTMDELIAALQAKKPDVRFIEREAVESLRDSDCLSVGATVFRNGGIGRGGEAVAFTELTPELLAFLRALYEWRA